MKLKSLILAAVLAFGVPLYASPTIPAIVDTGLLATFNSAGVVQTNIVVLGYSQSKNIYDYKSVFLLSDVTVNTPDPVVAAAAGWAVSDIVTVTSTAGYTNGLKGQVTTSTTLPTGISGGTDYFIRVLSATTFSLYDTYAHAIATSSTTGRVDITVIGVGNHTFTPTAIAGATVSLQGSIDDSTFVDITSSSQNVTVSAKFYWNISDTFYPVIRVKYVNTAGSISAITRWAGKSRP